MTLRERAEKWVKGRADLNGWALKEAQDAYLAALPGE